MCAMFIGMWFLSTFDFISAVSFKCKFRNENEQFYFKFLIELKNF